MLTICQTARFYLPGILNVRSMGFGLILGIATAQMPGQAGELVLFRGGKLKGELKSIEGDNLVWNSPVLGKIKVRKEYVKALRTATVFKARGKKERCKWVELRGVDAILRCSESDTLKIPFLTLEKLIPFEGHQKETFDYGGRLSVLGSQSRGNTTEQNWTLRTDNTLRYGDLRHNLGFQYRTRQVEVQLSNGDRGDGPVEEQYQAIYSLDWFVTDQVYYFNQGKSEKDDRRNIQERYNFSTGFGYQFWESKKTAFSSKLGALYTHEYFEDVVKASEDQREFASWQFENDFRYKLASGSSMYHKHEFSRSLEDNDEWEFDSFTGAQVPLGFGVSADLGLEYDYDNKPANATKEKGDTTFRVGVGYKW